MEILAKHLIKAFSRQTALNLDYLQIAAGERVALVGQNGAGKTTLIRCLLGHYQYQGELLVNGWLPRKHRVEVLREVGFVPQHPPPIQQTVRDLVRLSVNLYQKGNQAQIHALCEELGLDVAANLTKPFYKLSGGMKQKLLIALAFYRQPKLLIMDEPAANLDPGGRKAFFLRLAQIPEDTTVLLSSHRVDELLTLITRIIELDCGQMVLDRAVQSKALKGTLLTVKLTIQEREASLIKFLQDWSLDEEAANEFEGRVVDADRMRFINGLSQFAHSVSQFEMKPQAVSKPEFAAVESDR